MAVAFDAAAQSGTGFVSSVSWNHTCTGSNLALIVGVFVDRSGTTVSSVTYNSVACTQIGTSQGIGGQTATIWMYGLIGPATGTHSVSVTLTNANADIHGGSASYTGVDQTTGWHNTVQASATNASSISQTVTSATGDMVVDTMGKDDGAFAVGTPGSGQTQEWGSGNFSGWVHAASDKTGAASVTMSWSQGRGNGWAQICTDLMAGGGGSTARTQSFLLLGVGR